MSHRQIVGVFCGDICYQAAYLDWGEGPTLLFLHGFGGNKANWLAVMKGLAWNYRCISLDLLGFGESSQPAVEYDIALEVAFVSEVARTLGLELHGVVGHSFGAWVAGAYALEQSALAACILVAPIGLGGDGFADRRNPLWLALQQSPVTRGRSGDLSVGKLRNSIGRLATCAFPPWWLRPRAMKSSQPVAPKLTQQQSPMPACRSWQGRGMPCHWSERRNW